jgi:hypothetical protein
MLHEKGNIKIPGQYRYPVNAGNKSLINISIDN